MYLSKLTFYSSITVFPIPKTSSSLINVLISIPYLPFDSDQRRAPRPRHVRWHLRIRQHLIDESGSLELEEVGRVDEVDGLLQLDILCALCLEVVIGLDELVE